MSSFWFPVWAAHAPTCQNTGKRAEWLCCYLPVSTYATACMLLHEHTQSPTHTFALSQISPRRRERGPCIRASLGRCAECSSSWLVFWFWRPVFKMTEILQGLGELPASRWQIAVERTWDRLLMAIFPSAKALDHVRELQRIIQASLSACWI